MLWPKKFTLKHQTEMNTMLIFVLLFILIGITVLIKQDIQRCEIRFEQYIKKNIKESGEKNDKKKYSLFRPYDRNYTVYAASTGTISINTRNI